LNKSIVSRETMVMKNFAAGRTMRQSSFVGPEIPVRFFLALPAFCLETVFPGPVAGFGRAAALGEAGAHVDKGFKPGIGPFQVDPPGSFFAGFDDNFIFPADAGGQGLPESCGFRFRKPL
jgi:hypothetical protein